MRYYFDLNDQVDETGTELPSEASIPGEAIGLVLAVALDALETVQMVSLAVRDRDHRPVYQASLRLDARWADDAQPPRHIAAARSE